MSLQVVQVGADSEGTAWDRYVLDHPMACGYHLMAWRRVIEDAFGHRTFYLMVKDEHAEVRGVLPLVFVTSRFFGRFLVSMPFLNYGGVLADSLDAQSALLQVAVALSEELKASHIELRQQQELDLKWTTKQHKVSMRLELPRKFELIWNRFPSKIRTKIRRAQKEGMIVRVGGMEILEDFYCVFSRNMRDLGTPVYGQKFFESILKTFSKEARILAVYWKDQPLAAGFLYGFRNVLEIPWSSGNRRYHSLKTNMLLYSSVLEYGCREGFGVVDFGRSTPGSGTYSFKEQWGARPVQLHWYYWLKHGVQLPELNPQNPKYRIAIKMWQKLPIFLTKLVGPHVVKSIP